MKAKPHIAVIGAGAFGGWTALRLLERGARVTLLDAWGPGNSRASSGGETRIMRGSYGPDQIYTEMAARALKLWQKYERQWKSQFLHCSGVLWMASGHNDDLFERSSVAALRTAKIAFEELKTSQLQNRWPQINFEGIRWGILEPKCGYLDARASCQAVVDSFVKAGGKYRQLAARLGQTGKPDLSEVEGRLRSYAGIAASAVPSSEARQPTDDFENSPLKQISLSDSSRLKADGYVFACGPWLGRLFPKAIGDLVQPTKQDVFFFGTPAGDDRFSDQHLPVWGDHRGRFRYGIPSSDRRGFKIADDTRGPDFDPTAGERVISQEILQDVREYVAFRFPALKDAPVIETRVCQYEQTPDSHFIVDRHPAMENVWLLGGGSGHGFKHGPAIGEMMADLILKDGEPDAIWRLSRFRTRP